MIKAIAVDDEPLALSVIQHYCNQIDTISLEKTFTQQTEAIKHLHKFPVDVLFLDIQMPKQNGVDFFKNLDPKPQVIFTTAYSEYAVEGFNVNATDYLLKPFTFERFLQAIEKAQHELQNNTPNLDQDFLLIRADYKLNKIPYSEILYIEGLDDYIQIHLENKTKIVARFSMKSILEKLPQQQFIRIHRSYIIPIKNIKSVQSNSVTINDIELPIGATYKQFLSDFLQ